MQASYHFAVDSARSLVRITMSGFFAADDVARFVTARDRAFQQLLCAPNAHCTLVDIRAMAIQSQGAVAQFRSILAHGSARSRRLAFVVGASLARMQVMRAAAGRDARFFSDMAEAEAWLMQPDDAEIAA